MILFKTLLCIFMLGVVAVAALGAENSCSLIARMGDQTAVTPSPDTYRQIAEAVEANLQTHVLEKWFPASIDTKMGGFHQNFAEDWSRLPQNDRGLVYQSRLTWVASAAMLRYPAQASAYREYALHGLHFLETRLWDADRGGFYWALNGEGEPERNGEKHAYGIAFGIYAAATCYKATHDRHALDLAQRAYLWLDTHAHDPTHGGYYEALTRGGKPILSPAGAEGPQSDFIGTRYGYKSMNTHIHLLEALTALYAVAPSPPLKTRLHELFALVRDHIAVDPGCLNLFFTPSWRAIPDHDSFGHDVETAFLLVETATALGWSNDAKTWHVARLLVDHALEYGWDRDNGGFYDAGTAFGPPLVTDKIWWTQGEGLNALALMHRHYGLQTDRYWQAFLQQWNFIQKRQVDPKYGGWYPTVRKDGTPLPGHIKSDQWTEAYHQGRALLHVSETLKHMAEPHSK